MKHIVICLILKRFLKLAVLKLCDRYQMFTSNIHEKFT